MATKKAISPEAFDSMSLADIEVLQKRQAQVANAQATDTAGAAASNDSVPSSSDCSTAYRGALNPTDPAPPTGPVV